jgi:hypothetical protein
MDVDVVIDHVNQQLTIATEDEDIEMMNSRLPQFAEPPASPEGMQTGSIIRLLFPVLKKSDQRKRAPTAVLLLRQRAAQP